MIFPKSLESAIVFTIITYSCTIALFIVWNKFLSQKVSKSRESGFAILGDPLFRIIASLSMFIPLVSLLVLSMIYSVGIEGFLGFTIEWIRVDFRVVIEYFLAPIAPIIALIMYLKIIEFFRMFKYEDYSRIVGSRSILSYRTFLIVLLGYVAGITINAVFAFGEEIGWRAFLTTTLSKYFSIPITVILVGIVWGLWHTPLVLSLRNTIMKIVPWATTRIAIVNYIISCIVLSYPLTLLLLSSNSIAPPSAFHGTLNALWQIPQFVTSIREDHRYRDIVKMIIASVIAWCIGILIIVLIVSL